MQVRGKIIFHKYLINIQFLRFNGSKTGPVESSDSALTQRALRSPMRGVRQPATQVAPWGDQPPTIRGNGTYRARATRPQRVQPPLLPTQRKWAIGSRIGQGCQGAASPGRYEVRPEGVLRQHATATSVRARHGLQTLAPKTGEVRIGRHATRVPWTKVRDHLPLREGEKGKAFDAGSKRLAISWLKGLRDE
jgi:hypothetical protein